MAYLRRLESMTLAERRVLVIILVNGMVSRGS